MQLENESEISQEKLAQAMNSLEVIFSDPALGKFQPLLLGCGVGANSVRIFVEATMPDQDQRELEAHAQQLAGVPVEIVPQFSRATLH